MKSVNDKKGTTMTLRMTAALLGFAFLIAAPAFAHGPEIAHDPKHQPNPKMSVEPGGHGEALGRPGDPKAATRTVEVTMNDEMRFLPDRVTVKKGETVRFVVANKGATKHEMVLGTADELAKHAELMLKFPNMEHDDPNAVAVEPGKTGTLVWRFENAGTFEFACLVPGHFEAGMKGTLTVRK